MDGTGGTATATRIDDPDGHTHHEGRAAHAPPGDAPEQPGTATAEQPDGAGRPAGRTTRRSLLTAAGVGLVAAACAPDPGAAPPPAAPAPVPPAPVPWTLAQARTLADRATFGATKAVVDRIVSVGPTAWIDEQLAATGPTAEAMLAGYTTLSATNAQNEVQRNTDEQVLFKELDHAMLLRAVYSERQLYEVMCDFWSNHFTIWRSAKYLTQLKTRDDRDVIRTHALGRFSDLMQASAKSPAMLVYLDNYTSNAFSSQGVNENWGREILELHTLGIIGGTQVYTESDVRGVARVMSGRTIDWNAGPNQFTYRFNPGYASREAVSILGGQWSRPARTSGATGEADGDSLLAFLARHPSTARYICWKLCRRFVADAPSMALVDRLATVYRQNDTAIRPVLRALFLSPEFRASTDQKVKRPIEWLYSSLRATKAVVDPLPSGHAAQRLRDVADLLGQPLNERTTPDGYPEKAVDWVSAEGLLKRWEYGARLARNRLTDTGATEKVVVDLPSLLPAPLPATVRALVVALADRVFQFALSPTDADTIATSIGLTPTGAASTLTTTTNALQAAVGLLISHPSFQRR
jgi:uncharacterized protein (DUF1800 family)